MINSSQEDCERQSDTIRQTVYQAIWLTYVVFSLIALVIIVPILQTIFKFMLSPITTTLTRLKLLFSTVFLVTFLCTSLFHLIVYLTATSLCDYVFYVKDCVWSFPLITFCLIGIATSQAGLSVARLLTTVNVNAKLDDSKKMGNILAAVVVLISLVSLVLGLIQSEPLEPRVICALIPTSTANTSNLLFYFLLFLDFVTLFIYIVSWHRNKKLTEATWYSLTLKFKIVENYRGIKLCLPIVVMHFLMFGFYTISTIQLRNLRYTLPITTYNTFGLGLFIIPLYILVQNVLLYYILRGEMRKRKLFQRSLSHSGQDQTDIYFRGLYNQWNSLPGRR